MKNIGMIGVGNMASALADAIHQAGYPLILHDQYNERIIPYAEQLGAQLVESNALHEQLIKPADLIFIGVKPQQLEAVFKPLKSQLSEAEPKVWVSMAAGLSLDYLKQLTPASHRWIRIMPNTPVQYGQGFIAYAHTANTESLEIDLFLDALSKAGITHLISENQFEAVTGIAGSSPAFIYQLIEAMSDVGVKYGLSRPDSLLMAAQAVKGAANMVIESGEHPAVLKDKVTSPSGTTIEGVLALEQAGLRAAIIQGVSAAIDKAGEMNQ